MSNSEQGQPVRFGSVAGGGRYAARRRLPLRAGAGDQRIGVSRALAGAPISRQGSPLLTAQKPLPLVVVTAMDPERIGDYQRMVAQLRESA